MLWTFIRQSLSMFPQEMLYHWKCVLFCCSASSNVIKMLPNKQNQSQVFTSRLPTACWARGAELSCGPGRDDTLHQEGIHQQLSNIYTRLLARYGEPWWISQCRALGLWNRSKCGRDSSMKCLCVIHLQLATCVVSMWQCFTNATGTNLLWTYFNIISNTLYAVKTTTQIVDPRNIMK